MLTGQCSHKITASWVTRFIRGPQSVLCTQIAGWLNTTSWCQLPTRRRGEITSCQSKGRGRNTTRGNLNLRCPQSPQLTATPLWVVTGRDVKKELESQPLQGEQKGKKRKKNPKAFSCLGPSYAQNHKTPINVYRSPADARGNRRPRGKIPN